ncbi:MAG: hypothetical protein AAFN76_00705, partial [Pseudomonadota bacterium]
MKTKLALCAALSVLISGCDEFTYLGDDGPLTLKDWQAKKLLATGDGAKSQRFEGRVTGGQVVQA